MVRFSTLAFPTTAIFGRPVVIGQISEKGVRTVRGANDVIRREHRCRPELTWFAINNNESLVFAADF
jgi:hypothetical protein